MDDIKDYGITELKAWLRDFGYGKIFRMQYRLDRNVYEEVKIINVVEMPDDILLQLDLDPRNDDPLQKRFKCESFCKIELTCVESDQTGKEE